MKEIIMSYIKKIIEKILYFVDKLLYYNSNANSYKKKNSFQMKKMY